MDYISIRLEIAIRSMGARCAIRFFVSSVTQATLENLTPHGTSRLNPTLGKPLRERFRASLEPLSFLDNRAFACPRCSGEAAR